MQQLQLLFRLLRLGQILELFSHIPQFFPEVELGQFRWPRFFDTLFDRLERRKETDCFLLPLNRSPIFLVRLLLIHIK